MGDYAAKQAKIAAGMQEKRAELREKGGEVSLPVVDAAGSVAEREEVVAAD